MLFPQPVLAGIARGEITVAFRRWDRPRVRPGSRLRTAIGLVEIGSVEQVDASRITDADARRSGHVDGAELRAFLDRFGDKPIYRITVRYAGDDPRIALRESAELTDADVATLATRLARLDRASRQGPWTGHVLRLIADRPGVRAPDLAATMGRDTLPFKADVRKLKELGLTESLAVGYRLSPRGRALLEWWRKRAKPPRRES